MGISFLHDVCMKGGGVNSCVCVSLSQCERISSLAPLSLTDRVTETLLIQH